MEYTKQGDTVTVAMPETFGFVQVKEFRGMVDSILGETPKKCVFDFKETDMIDSSGIGSLVSVSRVFKEHDAVLYLRNLNDDVRELFIDTDLDKLFNIDGEQGVQTAEIDLFEDSVDVKLDIDLAEEGDIAVLVLKGVMNYPIAPRYFQQRFFGAMVDHKKILVDIEELTFLDSLCVSVLISMNEILSRTGGNMRICGKNYIVEDLFQTLNINKIIPCFESREEALADW